MQLHSLTRTQNQSIYYSTILLSTENVHGMVFLINEIDKAISRNMFRHREYGYIREKRWSYFITN